MRSQRAQKLAGQFTTLNNDLIAFVERCPEATWQATCPGEPRTVGVVAHHIASSHAPITKLVELVATGQPIPAITLEMLDHVNAEHAAAHAACTQNEVVNLLRANGEMASNLVAGLNDEQLDCMAQSDLFGIRMSAQQVVENVLLGHAHSHFACMRSAAEAI